MQTASMADFVTVMEPYQNDKVPGKLRLAFLSHQRLLKTIALFHDTLNIR
jgi:hypothetical protein